jgi:hypothetical protein
LLRGGAMFDPATVPAAWTAGAELNGAISYAEGEEGDFGDHGPLTIDLASPRFGVWGAFGRHRVDAPAFNAEGEVTAAWIRDAMGESEFAWDTLAVERSMLRLMMGSLAFDERHARCRFAETLLENADGPTGEAKAIAAAMAEFDGEGKALSNDFYFSRPEPDGSAGPRELFYPHLLLNCGRYLCNYKRRFLIQNALGMTNAERVETHRDLLIGDMTEDAKRAVRLAWTMVEDRRSIPMDRFFENETSLVYVEEFDCALRLWRQMAKPDPDLYEEASLACLGVARVLANAREAGLLARASARFAKLPVGAERAGLLERMNARLSMFAVARGAARREDAANEWREFAEFIALRAEEYEEDARMALGSMSDASLAKSIEKLFDAVHFSAAAALYEPLESGDGDDDSAMTSGEDLFHV